MFHILNVAPSPSTHLLLLIYLHMYYNKLKVIGEIGSDITLTIIHGCGIIAQASVYGFKAARFSLVEMSKNIKQFNEDPYIKAKLERLKRESNQARKRVNR